MAAGCAGPAVAASSRRWIWEVEHRMPAHGPRPWLASRGGLRGGGARARGLQVKWRRHPHPRLADSGGARGFLRPAPVARRRGEDDHGRRRRNLLPLAPSRPLRPARGGREEAAALARGRGRSVAPDGWRREFMGYGPFHCARYKTGNPSRFWVLFVGVSLTCLYVHELVLHIYATKEACMYLRAC